MIALVTGGAKRIGKAISYALAEAGYRVVIHANRSKADAEALAQLLNAQGRQAAVVTCDLADLQGLPAFYEAAMSPFGAPTMLINNASLFARDGLETLDAGIFSANLAVNLQAPVLLAKLFAAHLSADQTGAIINLIDQRVLRPTPQFLSYSLAKAGLWHATKTMAQALAPRIRVNGIGPGPTLPNAHDGTAGFEQEVDGTLLGSAVSPESIAEAVLYLARAKHVTGQMIAVDSGQHLAWQTPDIVRSS